MPARTGPPRGTRGAGSGRQPAGVAQRRVQQRRRDGGDRAQLVPGLRRALDRVGVGGLEHRLLLAGGRTQRDASGHQRRHGGDLLLAQRGDGVEAGHDRRGGLDDAVRALGAQRGRQHRALRRQPGPADVAEVQQPGGHRPAVGAAVGEDVLVVGVPVDDLATQGRGQRLEGGGRLLQRALQQCAAGIVARPRREGRDHLAGAGDVPLQDPVGGRVVEVGEVGGDAGHEPARGPQDGGGEMAGGVQHLALEVGEQADVVVADPDDLRTLGAGQRDGHRAGAARGDVRHRPVLQVELLGREGRARDLEHEAPAGRVDAEVLVLLTAQLAGLAADAEDLLRDAHGLLRRQPRTGQPVIGEGVGDRHATPAKRIAATAIPCVQATRSATGTCSCTPWATRMSPGP